MIGECPTPRAECPYAAREGCFSDTDHIVPRRLATTALTATYIDLPANKQQLCRWDHDQKTRNGDEPLPERAEMIEAIETAVTLGQIALSRRKRKAIFGRNRG